MKIISTTILIYYFSSILAQQTIVFDGTNSTHSIDSFLLTLHNKDVRFKLVWGMAFFDSTGNIHHSTFRRILTSVNVQSIKETYPKYLLLQKLAQLLDDSDKDWYCNLLLFSLTAAHPPLNPADRFIRVDTREKWIKPSSESTEITYKEMDAIMWRNYLSRISPTDKN